MATLTSDTQAGSPYVGPRPFTGNDQTVFFGRDEEIDRLISEVIASPTLDIYAASGAGKTRCWPPDCARRWLSRDS